MTDKDINNPIIPVSEANLELDECRKLRDEYLEGWQRSKADYANFKRETKERETETSERLRARLLEELLPVLESMDQARLWIKDLAPIEAQLEKVLLGFGLKPLGAVGESFDPKVHESVELVAVADENKDNIIVELVSSGYAIGEKILRPAKVKVGSYSEK